MSVFFTADTHFGHEANLVAAKRSFVSVEAMDGGLVDVWNAVVRSRDIGWHLGDFIDGRKVTADRCRKIFNASNGEKHLVRGHHD